MSFDVLHNAFLSSTQLLPGLLTFYFLLPTGSQSYEHALDILGEKRKNVGWMRVLLGQLIGRKITFPKECLFQNDFQKKDLGVWHSGLYSISSGTNNLEENLNSIPVKSVDKVGRNTQKGRG